MSAIYVVLGIFILPGVVAVTLAGLVGVFSVVIAFVRDAANRVAPDKPVAGNQIVSGGMVVLSQFAPVGVAASGAAFGAQKTYLFVAIMLAGACVLGAFLFRRYPRPQADANVKTSHAWNAQSVRLTIINFISAVAVGAAFGPFFEDVHRRGLEQSTWVLIWGLAGTVVGFFLIFIWSRVTHGLRDRGLLIAALVTLVGAVFEVVEHHQTGGTALVAGGITVSLGANAFEASVYDRPTTPGENIVKNFGRALGFGLGAFFALRLVDDMQYAWLILGASLLGVLVTFMLRKHWVQPVAPQVFKDWRTKAAVVFGASNIAMLVLLAAGVGVREIALILAGVAIIGVVVYALLHLRGWIKSWLGITSLEETVHTLETERIRDAERIRSLENSRREQGNRIYNLKGNISGLERLLKETREVQDRTREILGLPKLEGKVEQIKDQFYRDLEMLIGEFNTTSQSMLRRLDSIEGQLALDSVLTVDELVRIGERLREEIPNLINLERIYSARLRGLRRGARRKLTILIRPQYAAWLTTQSNEVKAEADRTQEVWGEVISLRLDKWGELAHSCAEKMRAERERLLTEAAENTRQAEALEQGLNDLS
jgi:hypothetical protein